MRRIDRASGTSLGSFSSFVPMSFMKVSVKPGSGRRTFCGRQRAPDESGSRRMKRGGEPIMGTLKIHLNSCKALKAVNDEVGDTPVSSLDIVRRRPLMHWAAASP